MITDGSAISVLHSSVQRTSLHTHPGVLEILLVLRGTLDVTVSCERFLLHQADYAVLNEGDPHFFHGSPDNVTAVLQLRLDAFSEFVPGLTGVIYACESFDLPRFRRTESSLRALILRTVLAEPEHRFDAATVLLRELSNAYAFEDYYERQRELTMPRRVQFRHIVGAMQERLAARDVLDQIADDQHYRKASLSRIVREASAVSFSDLLTYLRVSAAERRLVSEHGTVTQIAAECGFSDVKYLTRAFRAWFGESPADYRRRVRQLQNTDDSASSRPELGRALAQRMLESAPYEPGPPRLSVTPLLLKNLGGRADLFRTLAELAREPHLAPQDESPLPSSPHLLPIRVIPGDSAPVDWVDVVRGIDQRRFQPVLLIPSTHPELARSVATETVAAGQGDTQFWLTYETGLGTDADDLAREIRDRFGVAALPMRLG